MINKIVHEMALNGDSYKISAVVENFILNKVKEYFTDCSVSYQEKMVLTDDTEKSNNLFCSNFITKKRTRRFDIVIARNGKKHIIEIKHQVGGGTAIDSVGIYLEDKDKLKEYTKTENPVSLMILDFLPCGYYPRNKWTKRESFTDNPTIQARFNEYAKSQNVLVLLSNTYDEELYNSFFAAINERI